MTRMYGHTFQVAFHKCNEWSEDNKQSHHLAKSPGVSTFLRKCLALPKV